MNNIPIDSLVQLTMEGVGTCKEAFEEACNYYPSLRLIEDAEHAFTIGYVESRRALLEKLPNSH